ncbi:hypothetical protein VNI00_011136 [Paramarasmius palmivorus]|uniref:Uncharacterized protein n=1 Tax=Paramarasmius palmivorus TaxID=297713 RepID=A0AAW0CFJ1_9AGAR
MWTYNVSMELLAYPRKQKCRTPKESVKIGMRPWLFLQGRLAIRYLQTQTGTAIGERAQQTAAAFGTMSAKHALMTELFSSRAQNKEAMKAKQAVYAANYRARNRELLRDKAKKYRRDLKGLALDL